MTILTRHLMVAWATRGPSFGHSHSHGSSLVDTLLRSAARAFAWFTVRGLFDAIGLPLVILGAVVIGVLWLLRNRKRGDQA